MIDPQVRFRIDGGVGGPQLKLLCKLLPIWPYHPNVTSWSIAISQKGKDRSLKDVNLAFSPKSLQLLVRVFHSPGTH
jgi:hypothetical protein